MFSWLEDMISVEEGTRSSYYNRTGDTGGDKSTEGRGAWEQKRKTL